MGKDFEHGSCETKHQTESGQDSSYQALGVSVDGDVRFLGNFPVKIDRCIG
jgi:hypothetical protein